MPNALQPVQAFSLDAQTAPAAAVKAYQSDGVVCLRQAISADWLDQIEDGITAALNGASTDLDVVQNAGDTGKFTFSSQAWTKVAPFRAFIFDSPLPDLARQILQTTRLTLFYDFLLIKEAHSASAATPWHQDMAFYPLQGTQVINSWTALDPIPEETALRFWKGSHRSGTTYRAVNFEDPSQPYKHACAARPPTPDVDQVDEATILTTAMDPGDLLIFNARTLHAAPGNMLPHRRAGFSINWAGDDVTYDPRPALQTYLDPTLAAGDPLISTKFPQVRPVSSC